MPPDRKSSPWAFEDCELSCPKCRSNRIHRIFDRYLISRGVQAFECASCGNRFYDRDIDDYRPTFVR
ncbi:MAG: hypothetical protein ACW98Y_15895 [Candidatus Thorarchaeota archaeon]